jgi:hypothetical protein
MNRLEFIEKSAKRINRVFGIELLDSTGDIVKSEEVAKLVGENAPCLRFSPYMGIEVESSGVSIWLLDADYSIVGDEAWILSSVPYKKEYTEEDIEQLTLDFIRINDKFISPLRLVSQGQDRDRD